MVLQRIVIVRGTIEECFEVWGVLVQQLIEGNAVVYQRIVNAREMFGEFLQVCDALLH